MAFDGEATLFEQGEVGFGGVGGGALAGCGVGDDDEVAGSDVIGVGVLEEPHQGRSVLGIVLGDDVKLVATADDHFGEDGADVEVQADQQAVVGLDFGVAPVPVPVERRVNGGVGEVGELPLDVAGNQLGVVVLVEGFDETFGEEGVVGGFGADQAAVGVVAGLHEGVVHPAVALGGAGDRQLGLLAAAKTGEHHF